MAHGPLKKSTQINTKQHVHSFFHGINVTGALARAISSAMFGSILDNATLISRIGSNRFQAFGLMPSSDENADSHSYVVGNGISTFKAIFEM